MGQPFATLPFFSDYPVDGETYRYDICIYRSDHNACEQEGAGPCDTAAGVYYGSSDPTGGKLCPRHFYERHFGPQAFLRLVDPLGESARDLFEALGDIISMLEDAGDDFDRIMAARWDAIDRARAALRMARGE